MTVATRRMIRLAAAVFGLTVGLWLIMSDGGISRFHSAAFAGVMLMWVIGGSFIATGLLLAAYRAKTDKVLSRSHRDEEQRGRSVRKDELGGTVNQHAGSERNLEPAQSFQ